MIIENIILKIIFLPNSYQPNDNTREISRFKTNREEFYLPSDSFVFCSFNSNYKISINEFDIWMRVLKKLIIVFCAIKIKFMGRNQFKR